MGKSKWGEIETHLVAVWRDWWRNQGSHFYLKAIILLALSTLTAALLWNAALPPVISTVSSDVWLERTAGRPFYVRCLFEEGS
jgi:hypothetical protein